MSHVSQSPDVKPVGTAAAKTLKGVISLNMVEYSGNLEYDTNADNPLSLTLGTKDSLDTTRLYKAMRMVNSGGRDYYLYELDHDGLTYTLSPGDHILVYSDGSFGALVGMSRDAVKGFFREHIR